MTPEKGSLVCPLIARLPAGAGMPWAVSQELKPVPYRCPALFRMCVTFSSPHSSRSWTRPLLEPLCLLHPGQSSGSCRTQTRPFWVRLEEGAAVWGPAARARSLQAMGGVCCHDLCLHCGLRPAQFGNSSVWLGGRYQETKHELPGAPCPSSAPGSTCESKATDPLSLRTRS